ncbi:MAG: hypothetical protein KME35_02825 [Aphanocapsa sp. GSE-SYN-MK-11-07L]|nr:hypothetical protein [Aphanocapsa sp. GSE-SYN-MK-11-07L]
MFAASVALSSVSALPPAAIAQTGVSPRKVADQVYQRLPEFPLENQYLRKDNNQQATDSTLVERFIQYHTTVKGRTPQFRLDWKVTFADYLGTNDFLEPGAYPGKAFLKTNPLDGDRAIIRKLNRQQRDSLLQALVDIYAGGASQVTTTPLPPAVSPSPPPAPAPVAKPTLQPLPRSGDAQLLSPPSVLTPAQPRPTGGAQLLMP